MSTLDSFTGIRRVLERYPSVEAAYQYDLEPYLRVQRQALKRRLLDGKA